MKKKRSLQCYLAGSMEGRTYDSIKYEHYYVRSQLLTLGIDVVDPLMKEDHKPGKLVGLKNCGMPPKKVYNQDLRAVENSDIVLWVTGDIASEGSVTEIAWAGCINRYRAGKRKYIVVVSPRRSSGKLNHFANMHPNTVVVKDVDAAVTKIKRRYKI